MCLIKTKYIVLLHTHIGEIYSIFCASVELQSKLVAVVQIFVFCFFFFFNGSIWNGEFRVYHIVWMIFVLFLFRIVRVDFNWNVKAHYWMAGLCRTHAQNCIKKKAPICCMQHEIGLFLYWRQKVLVWIQWQTINTAPQHAMCTWHLNVIQFAISLH